MNSHVLAVSSWPFSSPLGEEERTKVRGSTLVPASLNPHPTLSALHPGRDPREANVALII
jgi:hypothetical protein